MEDSSTNPYIPQESEKIRRTVYEHQSPLKRIVKWSMITTLVVAILVSVGLFFVIPRTEYVDKDARTKFANILQPADKVQKQYRVESDLGFSLVYDSQFFSSKAQVGTNTLNTSANNANSFAIQTYSDSELRIKRPYNYVVLGQLLSSDSQRAFAPPKPQFEIYATTSAKDIERAAEVPENKDLSKLSVYVNGDIDKRKKANRVSEDNTTLSIEATKPVKETINGIDFQKVRFTTRNENYSIKNIKYDECYYTIQFNQPYALCVTNIRPINANNASIVEQLIRSVTFKQPLSPENSLQQQKSTDTPAQDNTELPLATIVPDYNNDANSLKAIAKIQPSVVRVGTLYCADLTLKFESGDPATLLTDSCLEKSSSGVFVSRDGYVATSGHAVKFTKAELINGYINMGTDQEDKVERLQRVLDYMLKARLILPSVADYLKRGANTGDPESLAKIQNLGLYIEDKLVTITKEEYTYAVQLTEKPISINREDKKPTFAYSDSVKEAKKVDIRYSPAPVLIDEFNNSVAKENVALLKVSSGSYPSAVISSNKTVNVKSKDLVNVVGYTSYADSSLSLDSNIRDFPIATVAKVEQVYDKDGAKIIKTDTPILPGNDGAPVVDNEGKLIGFASYGLTYCPDDQCFASGTVRPVSELLNLLDMKNITLRTENTITENWSQGVDEFFRGNYSSADGSFALSGKEYGANRWTTPMKNLSNEYKGKESDTSFMNQLKIVMIVSVAVLALLTVILAVVYWAQRKRLDQLQIGHYGGNEQHTPAQETSSYPDQQRFVPGSPQQSINGTSSNTSDEPNPSVVTPEDTESTEDPFYK